MASSIEWLNGGETWNPIKARRKSDGKKGWACVRISPGCEHCYSEAQNVQCGANRTRHGTGLKYNVPALDQVELYLDEEMLLAPLHWKKPRLIFPCSMTDWMADFVPDEWRDAMLAVMAMTGWHTYLSLTKRADRQFKYLTRFGDSVEGWIEALEDVRDKDDIHRWSDEGICRIANAINGVCSQEVNVGWPLHNLWLGVSAEDQQRADERIPQLLQTPAAIRWVSLEPLLGDISLIMVPVHNAPPGSPSDYCSSALYGNPRLDWGVIGLESGPKARPGNIEWIRSLVAQFQAAEVPVFVKQLGSKPGVHKDDVDRLYGGSISYHHFDSQSQLFIKKLNDPKGGDISEWPEDLRVREYPKAMEAAHASA